MDVVIHVGGIKLLSSEISNISITRDSIPSFEGGMNAYVGIGPGPELAEVRLHDGTYYTFYREDELETIKRYVQERVFEVEVLSNEELLWNS